MLSKTLDDTMSKAMKFENLTKATKFGNIFKNIKENNISENELLMLQKISDYVKPEEEIESNLLRDEILDYIIEKPDQTTQIFNFEDKQKTGLPFFRSIEMKLNTLYE